MALSDSLRHRQRLLDAITDEGLEDLTLRLLADGYPDAHRVRGKDGGVDVLSGYETPPARGWQAKNYREVPWDECRKSLASAMAGDRPPHYTFVFPFVLTKNQRDFWRDHFHPEQTKLYPDMELDYVDDLAVRLEDRPDLVDVLADGALSDYIRATLGQAAASGVNPLASAGDLATDPLGMAAHAHAIGDRDPNFSYSMTGREAGRGDREIGDRSRRFTMNHGVENLPDFSLEVREGDLVSAIGAERRQGSPEVEPILLFASDEDGEAEFARARIGLARGRATELDGGRVGLRPGLVPDRFREQVGDDGLLRGGRIGVGVSSPLELRVEVDFEGHSGMKGIPLFRIPAREPHHLAYGGSFRGAILTLDLRRLGGATDGEGPLDLKVDLGLTLGIDGERASDALAALGFARAFGEADRVSLWCPGLLPPEGLSFGAGDATRSNQEVWEMAVTVGEALALLEARDGVLRPMPVEVGPADLYAAGLVRELLRDGRVENAVAEDAALPLDGEDLDGLSPEDLLDRELEPPPVAGHATGLRCRRTLVDVEPVRITADEDGGRPRLLIRPSTEDARVVVSLLEG